MFLVAAPMAGFSFYPLHWVASFFFFLKGPGCERLLSARAKAAVLL